MLVRAASAVARTLDQVVGGLAEHLGHPGGTLGGDLEVLERRHSHVGDAAANAGVLEACGRITIIDHDRDGGERKSLQ